jgi:hypothetical protein
VVTGSFAGQIDFGGGMATSTGTYDGFVVALDAVTGKYDKQWTFSSGAGTTDSASSVAAQTNGQVVVAGLIDGMLTIGAKVLDQSGGGIFFATLDVSLSPLTGGSLPVTSVFGVAAGASGSFGIVGVNQCVDADIGCGMTIAGSGAVTTRYDASAGCVFATSVLDTTAITASTVSIDPLGNQAIAGSFATQITVDPNHTLTSAGGNDAYVIKWSPLGKVVWAQSFGGPDDDEANAVATDGSSTYVTGDFSQTADFGVGKLTSAGGADIFVAKLSR